MQILQVYPTGHNLPNNMADQNQEFIDLPVDAGRPLKVVCLGAGYSGILAAIRFPQRIPNVDFVIYEKNADIGGTWYENKCVWLPAKA